ncbi:MAG: GTP-binding protein [Clostridiaceae bacterium]|nr:GTP-binding protein [Clostridiaceae bacterium]
MHRSKNNSIKKLPVLLIIAFVILIIVGFIYLLLNKSKEENTSLIENNINETEISESIEDIQTAENNDTNNIPSTSVESDQEESEYAFVEKLAFVPDEFEKVQNFFGPLPEMKQNHTFEHQKVKAIYVNNMDYLDHYFELVEGTEVNAFVIDVKESWGLLYESELPLAKELNAIKDDRDLVDIFKRCHDNDILVIARIVCFKDSTMASTRPDLTISTKDNTPIEFPLEGYETFANPYDQDVWQYLIDVATEVISFGADEIQFDYIRFPSGQPADGATPYFGEPDEVPLKYSAINRFLQTAVIEIQENQNVPVGADLFSIVMTSDVDGKEIGQFWNFIGLTGIDNICPMIYPSHYTNASVGGVLGNGVGTVLGNNLYEAPDLEPYNVVRDAFVDGMPAIEQEGYATIRPYLQAFTAEYLPSGYYMEYTAKEIHEQIRASEDAGFDEWVLWNVQKEYPPGTFLPAENAD